MPLFSTDSERPEEGFTLVEVLVAFVISAILLSIIFAGFDQATRRDRVVRSQAQALEIARSRVEEFLVSPSRKITLRGREGGLQWQTTETSIMEDPRGLVLLSQFHIEVIDGGGHRLIAIDHRKLKTVKY
jgi:prepilin-type N-terminal cleavage/methylation domain-containing protein